MIVGIKKYIKSLLFKLKGNNFLFIVGCGHSGTSIMLSLLDNHKDVYAINNETFIFAKKKVEIFEKIHNWSFLANNSKKSLIVEKTPRHIDYIDKIFEIIPNAKVIIMLRDGRDVVCSIKARTGEFETAINKWIMCNEIQINYKNDKRVKTVKLEDLTRNAKVTLKSICKFAGLIYSEDMLQKQGNQEKFYYSNKVVLENEFHKKGLINGEKHLSRRNWQINQGLFTSTRRWQDEMTKEELQTFNEKAGAYLELYKYL